MSTNPTFGPRCHRVILCGAALLIGNLGAAEAVGRERDGAWQNSRGGTGTWSQRVERGPGASSRERGWTSPRGSGSRATSRAWERGSGTWQRQGTTAGAGGRQATSSVTGMRTESGHAVEGTRTGFAGGTTDTGYARTGSYATGSGGGNFSSELSREDGTVTQTRRLTTDAGKTYTKDVARIVEEGTATRTVTVIGPDGQTHTHSGSATRNP